MHVPTSLSHQHTHALLRSRLRQTIQHTNFYVNTMGCQRQQLQHTLMLNQRCPAQYCNGLCYAFDAHVVASHTQHVQCTSIMPTCCCQPVHARVAVMTTKA